MIIKLWPAGVCKRAIAINSVTLHVAVNLAFAAGMSTLSLNDPTTSNVLLPKVFRHIEKSNINLLKKFNKECLFFEWIYCYTVAMLLSMFAYISSTLNSCRLRWLVNDLVSVLFLAMSASAKNLYAVLKETYEEDWYDPQSFSSSLNVSNIYLLIIGHCMLPNGGFHNNRSDSLFVLCDSEVFMSYIWFNG